MNAEWSTTSSAVMTSYSVKNSTPADSKKGTNSSGSYIEVKVQAPPALDQSVECNVSSQSKVGESSNSDFSDDDENLLESSVL